MAAQKKAALARKPGKANLSGGSGDSGSGSDLKGGGGPKGGGKIKKPVARRRQNKETRGEEEEVSPGTTTRALSLKVQRQEKSEWCWAAVSVSVDRFFRPDSTHTQCDIAGSALNLPCCNGTQPVPSDACNTPHALHPVLGRHRLLAADPIVKPLAFDRVRTEIDAGRPVCILIKWLGNQGQVTDRGHFIALNGYRVTPAQKQFVSVTDPMYGSSEVAFEQFISGKGGYRDGRGVWFASFLVANEAAS